MKKTIILLNSNTYAIKAKKILAVKGITARVVKINRAQASTGCSFGIEINYVDYYGAIGELRENEIPYSIISPR